MTENRTCSKCGVELPVDPKLKGLCPRCLLILGLGGSEADRKRIGNYEILEELGRGGMGVVYRAYQVSLNRIVALKVLSEQLGQDKVFIQRFEREAKAAAKLNHPNVVTIHDIGRDGETCFIAMECVEGKTVADMVRERGQLELPAALKIVQQTLKALAAAHDLNIVHRDIKAQNIMVDEAECVKVADFGLAKTIEDSADLTQTGALLGTPAYMAPEQCKGEIVDARADLYAVGVLLYEMLAGRTPFSGKNMAEIVYKTVNEPVPPIAQFNSAVPETVARIIKRALAKHPADRYASAQEMALEVQDAMAIFSHEHPTVSKPPDHALDSMGSIVRSARNLLARHWKAAAILCGVALAGLWFEFKGKNTPPAQTNNLVRNASFEDIRGPGQPTEWQSATWNGSVKFEVADIAHTGKRSAAISSESGCGGWIFQAPVEPYTNYRLSAWIRTRNIVPNGHKALGAILNSGNYYTTSSLTGDNDWTYVEVILNSGAEKKLGFGCQLGGWDTASGEAWFDDIELVPLPKPPKSNDPIANGSFEHTEGHWPLGWATAKWSSPRDSKLLLDSAVAHTGTQSASIVSPTGSINAWLCPVDVAPNTEYTLSGWIKTKDVKSENQSGAWLIVTSLNHYRTPVLSGTNDWTRVETRVNSQDKEFLLIACQLGTDSEATGQAWFDDIRLDPVGESQTSGAATAEAGNLLKNAGFEEESEPGKPAQWDTYIWGSTDLEFGCADEGRERSRAVRIGAAKSGDGLWMQRVDVEPYRNYKLSGWIKTKDIVSKGGAGAYLEIMPEPGFVVALGFSRNVLQGTNDWTHVEGVFNSLGYRSLAVQCIFGGWGPLSGTAWYDDIRLEPMREVPPSDGQIVNGSFEKDDGGWPLGWSVRAWSSWAPDFAYAEIGHTGSRCAKISAKPHRNGLWYLMAKVKPNTSYRLEGWLRTENLVGGAQGNLAVGLPNYFGTENQPYFTEALQDTHDWTPVSVPFFTHGNEWIQIACQLNGSEDTAAGDAWFDDIALEEIPDPAQSDSDGPVNVLSLNTSFSESRSIVEESGNAVWFASDRPGGKGDFDLYLATRPSPEGPWLPPQNIEALNTPADDSGADLSSDGLEIIFASTREGGKGCTDLWRATRASVDAPWSAANPLTEANCPDWDCEPTISGSGLEVYFISRGREDAKGGEDLYVSRRPDISSPFGPAKIVDELSTPSTDSRPYLCKDDRLILFHSDRPGGAGGQDIWYATRPDASSPWSEPKNLTAANSAYDDLLPCVSIHRTLLYFGSNRPGGVGGMDIWMLRDPFQEHAAPRPAVPVRPGVARPRVPAGGEQGNEIVVNRQEILQELNAGYADLVTKLNPEMWKDETGKVAGITAKNIGDIPLAAKLGLKDGDILQSVNGILIDSEQKIMEVVNKFSNANVFRLGILREGKPTVLTLRIDGGAASQAPRRPQVPLPAPVETKTFELDRLDLIRELYYDKDKLLAELQIVPVKDADGVCIGGTSPNLGTSALAQKLGLQPGDVLTRLDGTNIGQEPPVRNQWFLGDAESFAARLLQIRQYPLAYLDIARGEGLVRHEYRLNWPEVFSPREGSSEEKAAFANIPLEKVIRENLGLTGPILRDHLLALRALEGAQKELDSLAGIEQVPYLAALWCDKNRIADLVPVAGLTSLESVRLEENRIVDLSPLAGLKNLKFLYLGRNAIADIAPLVANDGLGEGDTINLAENPLSEKALAEDIPALRARGVTVELVVPSAPQAPPTRPVRGPARPTRPTLRPAPAPESGLFANVLLEAAVRRAISKPTGELTKEDLAKADFTTLEIHSASLPTLQGLEMCTGLTNLDISHNGIVDLNALSGLTRLEYLGAGSNQIQNVGPLSGLTNLTRLHLDNNPLGNLGPLAPLVNLKALLLYSSGIRDIQALQGLTQLMELNLDNNRIEDIRPLEKLVNLAKLNIADNKIVDISPLRGLNELTSLVVGGNPFTDASPLADLRNLKSLSIGWTRVADVTPLGKLTGLEYLMAGGNPIADPAPLGSLANLKTLWLDNCGLSDISALLGLNELREVYLSKNRIQDIGPLHGLPKFSCS